MTYSLAALEADGVALAAFLLQARRGRLSERERAFVRNIDDLSRGLSLAPRGSDFVRCAMAMAVAKGDMGAAERFASDRWGATSRAAAVTKAAVSAMTTGAAETQDFVAFQGAVTEFFGTVAQTSIVGRLSGLRRVPLYTRSLTPTGATAYWVGEGQAKPVSRIIFAADTLAPRKVMGLTVATRELLESADPNAETVIRADLTRAVVQALDEAFIDPTNAGIANVTPASVTNGLSALSATADLSANLKDLIAAFAGDLNAAYLVMHPELAVGICSAEYPRIGARGGDLAGIPVIASRNVADGVIVLIDPTGVAYAEGPGEVRTITQGDVYMDTAPAMAAAEMGSPSAPVTGQLVGLWQTNAAAILAGRTVNWQTIRSGAVALITGAAYGDAA